MPTRDELLADEERRLKQLRFAVGLAMGVIGEVTCTVDEALDLVAATRALALRLFPGKELAFDLIYRPRFQRLLVERFPQV